MVEMLSKENDYSYSFRADYFFWKTSLEATTGATLKHTRQIAGK